MSREQEIEMIKGWIRQGLTLDQMAKKLELKKHRFVILLESYGISVTEMKRTEGLWK